MNENDFSQKLDPLGGILPQELITGDILRGYGPRRGNLERLLRYWRPIMRKPGGFRRCRVILADHPELYPLNNICAWLHHETTGLWPNEGCHHPGMKNCRGKLKKRNWSNVDFSRRLRSLGNPKKKSLEFYEDKDDVFFHEFKSLSQDELTPVVTNLDIAHGIEVLRDFIEMEEKFIQELRNVDNWEIHGEDEDGQKMIIGASEKSLNQECCSQDDFI